MSDIYTREMAGSCHRLYNINKLSKMRFSLFAILLSGLLTTNAAAQALVDLDCNDGATMGRARSYIALPEAQAASDMLTATFVLDVDECEDARWLDAEALFRMGRYVEAEPLLRSFLADETVSAHHDAAQLRVAECLLGRGCPDEAMKKYTDVHEGMLSDEMQQECRYGKGVCLLLSGRDDAAREQFELVSHEGGTLSSAANYYLGVMAYNDGDYSRAKTYLEKTDATRQPGMRRDVYLAAMEEDPGTALRLSRRALSVSSLSASEKAAANFTAGQACWALGDREQAVQYLNAHVQTADTPQSEALYMLGVNDYDHGRYDAAGEHLSEAARASGVVGQRSSAMLGQAYKAQGKNDEAAAAFRHAADGEDAEVARQAYYNYAVTKYDGAAMPFSTSAATFEDFLRRYPTGRYSDQVRQYLARGYLADEDYDRALSRLQAIEHPTDESRTATGHVHYLLGVRELNAGNTDSADSHLQQASALIKASGRHRHDTAENGGNTRQLSQEIELAQGRVALKRGQFGAAQEKLAHYADNSSNANVPYANYYLGYAQMGLDHLTQADDAFGKAEQSGVFSGRELADILNRRADIACYEEDYSGAGDLYRRAEQADPASGDYAAYRSAKMCGYARDYREQTEKIAHFTESYPTSTLLPDALLDRAAAEVALSERDAAIDTYDTLIERYPLTAQGRRAYISKAMTLLEDGRGEEAAETYKEIIQRYPTSQEALQASELLRAYLADRGRGAEYLEFIADTDGAPTVDCAEAAELAYGTAERLYDEGDSSAMERFLAEYPDAAQAEDALALLAAADYDADRTEQALERWQTLAERASDAETATEARMGIMRSARDLGRTDIAGAAAQAVLESSAASAADYTEAAYTKAFSICESDTAAAVELWLSVADRTDELYGAKSAVAAAETLYEAGEYDRAITTAKALAGSRSPHSYWVARAFIVEADALKAQGHEVEAHEYLRALRDNYPGSEPDIQAMIEQRL